MKKRLLACILLVFLLIPAFTLPASADTGPKPSVVVDFTGLEDEIYFVTLLSESRMNGPWNSDNEYQDWNGDRDAWAAFSRFEDSDGYYFIGNLGDCSETDEFSWGYYPPDTFKMLIYFPEYDSFAVSSGSFERYAFDSYYTVDASGIDVRTDSILDNASCSIRSYNYAPEVAFLVCRIVLTIAIELLIALLFGFRGKKQILVILITNAVTQVILNVLLNVILFTAGGLIYTLNYIWMEALVFVIEGAVYAKCLPRHETRPERRLHPWLYALSANAASLLFGILISELVPQIF